MKKIILSLVALTSFVFAEEFTPSSFESLKTDTTQVEYMFNADTEKCGKTTESFNTLFGLNIQTSKEAIELFEKTMKNENCSVDKLEGANMTKIYCQKLEITFLFFDSIENCESMTVIE